MNYENEITVEVDTNLENLINILEERGFKLKEEYDLNDIYLINKNDKENDYLSMLNKCVLIRHIIEKDKETNNFINEDIEILSAKEVVWKINYIL